MQQTLSLLTIYQVPSLTKQSKQIDTRGISKKKEIIALVIPCTDQKRPGVLLLHIKCRQ